jgi:uncharacterized membrane protein
MVYFQWNKAMIERFLNDPLANSLAVIVLVALVASWVASLVLTLRDEPLPLGKSWYAWLLPLLPLPGIPAAFDLLRTGGLTFVLAAVVFLVLITSIVVPGLRLYGKIDLSLVRDWPRWAIPLLVVGGLAVAGYLTFVESTGAQIACGLSGGCAHVQESKYATLFGFLRVSVLGLIGYLVILTGWLVQHFGPPALKKLGVLTVWGMAILGVFFSAYLTFLEPFVIGTTCTWCICSAVIMMTLLWVSTPQAQQALASSPLFGVYP